MQRAKVSQFWGIIIEMSPLSTYLPHIIASFGEHEAMFGAESGALMEGEFPEEQRRLVKAWVLLHKDELKKNWEEKLKNPIFQIRSIAPLT